MEVEVGASMTDSGLARTFRHKEHTALSLTDTNEVVSATHKIRTLTPPNHTFQSKDCGLRVVLEHGQLTLTLVEESNMISIACCCCGV